MNALDYYRSQSKFTDPGEFSDLFSNLPTTVGELCQVVYGLVVHRDTTRTMYGFELPSNRQLEADTRFVSRILERIVELDDAPLSHERDPKKRFLGSCRDFAILLCSILRNKNVPARLRCGFDAYWRPGLFDDHWVCQYWSATSQKWTLVDAEIGPLERRVYDIRFDQTDVPRDQSVAAGRAWKMCRRGGIDPDLFGVHGIGIKGVWFVRSNVLRDLAALYKMELLPWDYTEFSDKQFERVEDLPLKEIELIDLIADLTCDEAMDFDRVISAYENNPDVQVGATVRSYTVSGPATVTLGP